MTNSIDNPHRARKWLAVKWLVLTIGGLALALAILVAGLLVYDLTRPLSVSLPAEIGAGSGKVDGAHTEANGAKSDAPIDQATTKTESKSESDASRQRPIPDSKAPLPVPDEKNLIPLHGLKPELETQAEELNKEYAEVMRLMDDYRGKWEGLDFDAAFAQMGIIMGRYQSLGQRFSDCFGNEKAHFLWSALRLTPLWHDVAMRYYELFTQHGHWIQAATCCREFNLGWDREVACARRAGTVGVVYLARRRYEQISDAADSFSQKMWAYLE